MILQVRPASSCRDAACIPVMVLQGVPHFAIAQLGHVFMNMSIVISGFSGFQV